MRPDPYPTSHLVMATREVGAVATSAEAKIITKYAELARTHHMTPPWQLRHPECLLKGS